MQMIMHYSAIKKKEERFFFNKEFIKYCYCREFAVVFVTHCIPKTARSSLIRMHNAAV